MRSWVTLSFALAVALSPVVALGQPGESATATRSLGRVVPATEQLGLVEVDGKVVIVSMADPSRGIDFDTGATVTGLNAPARPFEPEPRLHSGFWLGFTEDLDDACLGLLLTRIDVVGAPPLREHVELTNIVAVRHVAKLMRNCRPDKRYEETQAMLSQTEPVDLRAAVANDGAVYLEVILDAERAARLAAGATVVVKVDPDFRRAEHFSTACCDLYFLSRAAINTFIPTLLLDIGRSRGENPQSYQRRLGRRLAELIAKFGS